MLTFLEFIDRDSPLSETDKVLVVIKQAGPQGIARGALGGQIKLKKESLDQVLMRSHRLWSDLLQAGNAG